MKAVFEFIKCAFIPFYAAIKLINLDDHGNDDKVVAATVYGFILALYIIIRFSMGISDANLKNKCRLRSLANVINSPMYALGCNLGKHRFDIKVN